MALSPKNFRDPHPRRRWQFGIGSMLLFTALFALLMGAFSGMIRSSAGEHFAYPRLFLVLAVAAPLGMLVVIGGCRTLILLWKKRKNREL